MEELLCLKLGLAFYFKSQYASLGWSLGFVSMRLVKFAFLKDEGRTIFKLPKVIKDWVIVLDQSEFSLQWEEKHFIILQDFQNFITGVILFLNSKQISKDFKEALLRYSFDEHASQHLLITNYWLDSEFTSFFLLPLQVTSFFISVTKTFPKKD